MLFNLTTAEEYYSNTQNLCKRLINQFDSIIKSEIDTDSKESKIEETINSITPYQCYQWVESFFINPFTWCHNGQTIIWEGKKISQKRALEIVKQFSNNDVDKELIEFMESKGIDHLYNYLHEILYMLQDEYHHSELYWDTSY